MKQMMRMIIIIIDKHFHNHISSHGGLAVETINRQSGADGERERLLLLMVEAIYRITLHKKKKVKE